MQKLILLAFVAVGALLGLLSAAQDDWGTRVVMMGIGILFAAPIGAVLGRAMVGRHKVMDWQEVPSLGGVASPKELSENFWRDGGHPPFMKPSDAPPDRRQFDPDRLG